MTPRNPHTRPSIINRPLPKDATVIPCDRLEAFRNEYYGHYFFENQNLYVINTPMGQLHPAFDHLVVRILLEDANAMVVVVADRTDKLVEELPHCECTRHGPVVARGGDVRPRIGSNPITRLEYDLD